MAKLSEDIIVMCVSASYLFTILSVIKPLTQKWITSSWHYNILRVNILLFFIPIHSIVLKIIILLGLPEIKLFRHVELFTKTVVIELIKNENTILSATSNQQNTHPISQESSFELRQILFIIWIFGMFVSIIWQLYCRFCLKKELQYARKVTDSNVTQMLEKCKIKVGIKHNIAIMQSEHVYSPMLIGLIHPKILLPAKEIPIEHMEYVFTHELIHDKRKDLWWKALLLPIISIFWFNPLIYFLKLEVEKELELSCDERVVNGLCSAERKKYGLAILESIDSIKMTNQLYGVHFSAPKLKLERRLTKMLNFKSMKKTTKIFSSVLAITLVSTALVPALASEEEMKLEDNPTIYGDLDLESKYAKDTIVTYEFARELEDSSIVPTNIGIENMEEWIEKIENGTIRPNSFEHIQSVMSVEGHLPINAEIVEKKEYYIDEKGLVVVLEGIEEIEE